MVQSKLGISEVNSRISYENVNLLEQNGPLADDEVYVSMQFSSGKVDMQPNLLANIGKPRSATIKKVRMNLLVEEILEGNVTDSLMAAFYQSEIDAFP